MKIDGKLIEYKEFEIDKKSIMDALLIDLGWLEKKYTNEYITIDNIDGIECIVKKSDHSYHGSPDYQIDSVISSKEEDIELYKLIIKLRDKLNKMK